MVSGIQSIVKGKSSNGHNFQRPGTWYFGSVKDGITATPSGTQTTSLLLTEQNSRVTTVASAGDGVRLPPALPGLIYSVVNDAAANAMNVFPASAAQGGVAGGDKINSGSQNAAFSQAASNGAAGGPTLFYCFTLGTWRTK